MTWLPASPAIGRLPIGLLPLTQEHYLYGAKRLAGKQPEAVTGPDGYAFLVHLGGELGVSASWYNVLFTAVVRWFEFRSQVVVLKGLRPQRRPSSPPRSWSVSDPDIRTFETIANRQAQRWASTRSR